MIELLTSLAVLSAALSGLLDWQMQKASAIEDSALRFRQQRQAMRWVTACAICCTCFCLALALVVFA